MNSKPSPASIVIMASGAVMLLFSFFDWFEDSGFSVNAWGGDFYEPFPLFTYAPVFGAISAGLIAARTFGNLDAREIAGFTINQIVKALSIFSLLLMIGIWVFGEDAAIGLILNLLGSIGLVVGAFMGDSERGPASTSGPATPF